jgi:toxin ParE1/3/4
MPRYVLTSDAQQDLREIARYTRKEWGEEQTLRYGALLDACLDNIAEGACISRAFSERYPNLRVMRCEHHYVFYLQPANQPPCIIAVLHERMDMLQRLKARLS